MAAALLVVVTGCGLLDWIRGEEDETDPSGETPEPSAGLAATAPSAAAIALPSSSSAVRPSASTSLPSPCPPGMALVDARFCIDRWEATTVGQDGRPHSPYHAVGRRRVQAVSRSRVAPQGYISMQQADAACRRAGKRLCTTQQWIDACTGKPQVERLFPYGMKERPGACNTERRVHPSSRIHRRRKTDSYWLNDPRLNQLDGTVAKTGAFDECVTPEGVYDLHGNLAEWTRGARPRPLLMGGYYLDGRQHGLGCRYVTDGHGAQYHDFSTGFRCCASPDPELLELRLAANQSRDRPQLAPAAPVADDGRASRDPPGMRSFLDPLGELPAVRPPTYESPNAKCPSDMVYVAGIRCAAPQQRCLRWLPRRSQGQKIACAEFKQPSVCTGLRPKMDYCIDRYEFTPPGYTYPLTHVSWTEAQNLCRAVDKRLCFEDEWEFACEGPEALPYPYGYVRDGKRCNHDFPEPELVTPAGEFVDRRVAKDSLPGCVSPFGVHNLVGNVDEWTTRRGVDSPYRAILRGGWWLVGRNRCRAATANHGELYAGMQTGFRCCRRAR
jgi:sulfatase modifying factor 1